MEIVIEKATLKDFKALYSLGLKTPELKVNRHIFMKPDEFRYCIKDPKGLFLVAKNRKRIAGFLYADMKDTDKPSYHIACLVYIAVHPSYRRNGIAKMMLDEAERSLKKMKVKSMYALANAKSESVLKFLESRGYNKGHDFFWMEKRLR